jgi:hypothetical protein
VPAANGARPLLDSVNTTTLVGLRDRLLIGIMIHSVGRVDAVIKTHVEGGYVQ